MLEHIVKFGEEIEVDSKEDFIVKFAEYIEEDLGFANH